MQKKSGKLFVEFIDLAVDLSSHELIKPQRQKLQLLVQDLHRVLDDVSEEILETYLPVPYQYLQNLEKDLNNPEFKSNPDILTNIIEMSLDNLWNYVRSFTVMLNSITFKEAPRVQTKECSLAISGLSHIEQKIYRCHTCSLGIGKLICEACISICHKNHDVYLSGNGKGFCDCRFNRNPCAIQSKCSYVYTKTKYQNQICYVCETCGLTEAKGSTICQVCIESCHKDHQIKMLGMKSCYCDCFTSAGKCFSKEKEKEKEKEKDKEKK